MQTPIKPSKFKNGGNPKPRSRAKPVECPTCRTVYPQRKGNFSNASIKCKACCARAGKACNGCGTFYTDIEANFRRVGQARKLSPFCHECHLEAAYARIEKRLARRAKA